MRTCCQQFSQHIDKSVSKFHLYLLLGVTLGRDATHGLYNSLLRTIPSRSFPPTSTSTLRCGACLWPGFAMCTPSCSFYQKSTVCAGGNCGTANHSWLCLQHVTQQCDCALQRAVLARTLQFATIAVHTICSREPLSGHDVVGLDPNRGRVRLYALHLATHTARGGDGVAFRFDRHTARTRHYWRPHPRWNVHFRSL